MIVSCSIIRIVAEHLLNAPASAFDVQMTQITQRHATRRDGLFGRVMSCTAKRAVVIIVMLPHRTPWRTTVLELVGKGVKEVIPSPSLLARLVPKKISVAEAEAGATILDPGRPRFSKIQGDPFIWSSSLKSGPKIKN